MQICVVVLLLCRVVRRCSLQLLTSRAAPVLGLVGPSSYLMTFRPSASKAEDFIEVRKGVGGGLMFLRSGVRVGK